MSEQVSSQDEILADYADGPNRLEAAIAGLSEMDLDMTLGKDSWTIRQIVHHVMDGDDIWKVFIKRAIGNPGGKFSLEWYWQMSQDEWTKRWAYQQRGIEPSLALLCASRRHVVQLLKHIPGAWEKTLRIRWPNEEEQQVSVRWVIEMQTRHIEGHIGDIRKIRDVYGI